MRSGLPRKFGVLIVSVRRTISGTVGAPVVPVELGLAQLFQTKPQGPIYRPMRLGRCGWERLACPLPSPAMVKEESLSGGSGLKRSSPASEQARTPRSQAAPVFAHWSAPQAHLASVCILLWGPHL